ncbi:MAG: copper amine oxidase N-terminal domain-containing protein [Clostridiales bacterium]|jgi:phage baseplate assembly protein gpV|nr:copper amine oxidase N-terminal domain-containing protein [Clostridiales bacterium]
MRFKGLPLLLAFAFHVLAAISATAAQLTARVDEADPVHNVNHDFGRHTFTWSDGTSAVYDLNYKPLIINGSLIKAEVKTANDRTLAPVRAIVENLGDDVSWDEKSQKVAILKDGKRIEMTIGSTVLIVNGLKKSMDASPAIYNGRTYLPVRFASENLDVAVSCHSGGDVMIVAGVQGNVFVNQKITAVAIAKEQAVKTQL